jgi:hypothetical protein
MSSVCGLSKFVPRRMICFVFALVEWQLGEICMGLSDMSSVCGLSKFVPR